MEESPRRINIDNKRFVILGTAININAIQLIIRVTAFLYNNFKLVDDSEIRLIKDELYDNIDYFICLKTDFISLLAALLKGK